MKHTITQISALVLAASALNVQAAEWDGDLNLLLGGKTLDSSDWDDRDDHGAIGFLINFQQKDWPLAIVVDMFGTGKEQGTGANRIESYTAEMHLGARHYIDAGKFRPYLGAGLSLVFAEENRDSVTYDQTTDGTWVGAGVQYAISDSLSLMLDVRHSQADLTLNGVSVDAGGTFSGLGIGYRW